MPLSSPQPGSVSLKGGPPLLMMMVWARLRAITVFNHRVSASTYSTGNTAPGYSTAKPVEIATTPKALIILLFARQQSANPPKIMTVAASNLDIPKFQLTPRPRFADWYMRNYEA